jgi:DNA-binding LacI/PurR family transcriptional regulator
MVRQLLRIAQGEDVEEALILPTELVVRESA